MQGRTETTAIHRRAGAAGVTALRGLLAASALAVPALPAGAHPHVFVDGTVDFVLRDGAVLEALEVSWRHDAFETLFILATYDMTPNPDGTLDDADRAELARLLGDWPEDFAGAEHLKVDGAAVVLDRPTGYEVRLVDGQLESRFVRRLPAPLDLRAREVELAMYEATYFYAFTIAAPPGLLGDAQACTAQVLPFEADTRLAALQDTLFSLSREETPAIENVGALFADRIALQCV